MRVFVCVCACIGVDYYGSKQSRRPTLKTMLYPDCVVHLHREPFGVQPNTIAIEIQFTPSLAFRVTGAVVL